jgi:hypothetical protein
MGDIFICSHRPEVSGPKTEPEVGIRRMVIRLDTSRN